MVHTDGAWPGHFHSAPLPAGRKELVPNVKSFVILCVPAEDKIPPLKKHRPVLFFLFLFPLPFYLRPPIPPPLPLLLPTPKTLTLACLSGLLPCIPPSPVWPLSQEVAQLVDKHHGNGEGGLGWGSGASLPVVCRVGELAGGWQGVGWAEMSREDVSEQRDGKRKTVK